MRGKSARRSSGPRSFAALLGRVGLRREARINARQGVAGGPADPGVAVSPGRLKLRGTAGLASSPNDPSPIAALSRTSASLSLRHSIIAGTIFAASAFRSGKSRTAMIRSRSWPDLRSAINSSVDFVFAATPAHQQAKQQNKTRSSARMAELRRYCASPKLSVDFAASDGAEVLVRVAVDFLGEESHRAIAEQEVRSPFRRACCKTCRGRKSANRRRARATRCRGPGPRPRRSPRCRRRDRAEASRGSWTRHPGRASALRPRRRSRCWANGRWSARRRRSSCSVRP